MSKFDRAVKAAENLPEDLREDLLHYIDKYLALRDDIAIGVAQLERGEVVDGEVVFARLGGSVCRLESPSPLRRRGMSMMPSISYRWTIPQPPAE